MEHKESVERFVEGLKKAISRTKELGHAQKNNDWFQVSTHLRGILHNGQELLKQKPPSRQETLQMIGQREKLVAARTEAERLN